MALHVGMALSGTSRPLDLASIVSPESDLGGSPTVRRASRSGTQKALRPPGKWRYSVDGATLSRCATSSTMISLLAKSVLAASRSFGDGDGDATALCWLPAA